MKQEEGAGLDAAASDLIHSKLFAAYTTLTAPGTVKVVTRSLSAAALALFALSTAILCYLQFYWSYIPSLSVQQPVYLQYSYVRPPHALIHLDHAGQYLAQDQAYDATLNILVPTSDSNFELGNFMVNFETRNSKNQTLFSSSRPSSLIYQSPVVRNLYSLTSPRVLLGVKRAQSQHLSIRLADKVVFYRGSTVVPKQAYVEIGRRDHSPSVDPRLLELQVYDANLQFDASFSGLRYLMYHYRLASFAIFTSTFFLIQVFSALTIWSFLVYQRSATEPSRSSKKPSQSDYLRAADRAEAEDVKQRREEAALAERRRMIINPSRHTVLAALREKDQNGTQTPDETEEDDQVSSHSWEHAEVASPVKEEAADNDDKDTVVSGGSSTTRASQETFGTFRSDPTTATSESSRSKSD